MINKHILKNTGTEAYLKCIHPIMPTRFGSCRYARDWVRDRSQVGLKTFRHNVTSQARMEAWARKFGFAQIITKQGWCYEVNYSARRCEREGFYPAGRWYLVPRVGETHGYNGPNDWPLGSFKIGEPHRNEVLPPEIPMDNCFYIET